MLEREPKQWHTLILLDSGRQVTDFVNAQSLSSLVLRFDDVEGPSPNLLPPSGLQIAQALTYAKGKERLLVSCRAGRGRSVALAYLITYQARGVADALAVLDPTRHRPNRLVVRLGESVLEKPGALSAFDDWCARHAHIQLSDYYDEMEKEFEALEAQGATNRICP
ncbi:hypothetical protein R5W24_000152 [Gemmata sp. JC717]|uniref:hypothetical protein n=1 Tax=Gemmata algarum TaxID=2975278 RepID=UPI0021BB6E45|nr:hypothetical protein [Gemmata algarum]MDY3551078.1 hypothetical protein [Gemmata algarum]